VANKPISVTIKGDYSDRDIKRAMKDLDSLRKQGPKTSQALRSVGKGFAIAGAAAGAAAIAIGYQSVKAAAAEEEAVAKLNKTLENMGLARDAAGVEKFIDDMQFATGVADDQLRPAFSKLVVAIGDTGKAMDATQLAMDIAAGTGKDLASVSLALSKAYTGNAGALGRLGVPLDKALIKSGDMVAITKELSKVFGGQAAASAQTLTGKMRILDVAVDELSESFGIGLAEGLLTGTDGVDDASQKLRDMQNDAESLGRVISGLGASLLSNIDPFLLGSMKVADSWDDAWAAVERFQINVQDMTGEISDEEGQRARDALDAADIGRDNAMRNFARQSVAAPPDPSEAVVTSRTLPGGGITNVYNFNGGIRVESGAALTQVQKQAARLAALSGSRYAGMAATGQGYAS
jgi:hypothetical protein